MTLKDINTNTIQGKILFALLIRLSVTIDSDKTHDQILEEAMVLANKMFPTHNTHSNYKKN